jgi:hypothetical protein
VDFSGGNGPLLLVNSRLGDWKAVASMPAFRCLVYPAAMRDVLWCVYKVVETDQMDDADDWRCRWLQFAAALPGVGDPPLESSDDGQWEEWITRAVESFARRHDMLKHYKDFLADEGSA